MFSNEKLNPIVTELFIRGRELKISHVLSHSLIFLCEKILDSIYALFHYENSKETKTSTNCI